MAAESRYGPFWIAVERSGHEAAILVGGDLDLASAGMLEREVGQERLAGSTRIVIDLSAVEFIDSSGLRTLLALRNDAKRHSHALLLVAPPPQVMRIFKITGTRTLFEWQEGHGRP